MSAPAGPPLLLRVDNRLVHGQVLEAWVPALGARALLVADDEAASDELARAAMSLAIPPEVTFEVLPLGAAAPRLRAGLPPGTLVLVREVGDALALARAGAPLRSLNLGNVHFRGGRRAVAPTVWLDAGELAALEGLCRDGTQVEARAVPADGPVGLAALRTRFDAGA